MDESSLWHFSGNSVQQVTDGLVSLSDGCKLDNFLQSLGNFLVLESAVHDFRVKADGKEKVLGLIFHIFQSF